jgi:hypothetical protein
MNRKDFFKKLGIGIATVIVAPKILAEIPAKEETFPNITENNGELVEIRLFNYFGELSRRQYKRQTVPYGLKWDNNSVKLDMPNIVFPIKGKAIITEVGIFHKQSGQDWGRILHGTNYEVWDGCFTLCFNG